MIAFIAFQSTFWHCVLVTCNDKNCRDMFMTWMASNDKAEHERQSKVLSHDQHRNCEYKII